MPFIANLSRPRVWIVPMLALLLFLIGTVEHPRALDKMQRTVDTWHTLRYFAAMLLVSCAACWIGWRAQWPSRLAQFSPRFWMFGAIVVALVPAIFGWKLGYRPVWKTGLSGVHVDAALLSMLCFFGGVARLRLMGDREVPPHGWKQSVPLVMLCIAWSWVVTYLDRSAFVVVTSMPVAMVILHGTAHFRALALSAGVWILGLFDYIVSYAHIRIRLLYTLFPYSDPQGRGFIPSQLLKSFCDSGWLGRDRLVRLPSAAHQFMLSTVCEHSGWLALLLVVGIASAFLLIASADIRRVSDGWLRHVASAVLGFLIAGSVINLIANLGLTGPAGLGIPFLARDWFLAAIAAFAIGVAQRGRASV